MREMRLSRLALGALAPNAAFSAALLSRAIARLMTQLRESDLLCASVRTRELTRVHFDNAMRACVDLPL